MKRKLIWIFSFASFLAAGSALAGGPDAVAFEPEYFSGFYVGVIGGLHLATFDGSTNVNASEDVVLHTVINSNPPLEQNFTVLPAGQLLNNDIGSSSYNGYIGFHGGVGKTYNYRWFTGVDVFGEFGSQKDNETNNGQIVNFAIPNALASANYSTSTSTSISNDYGIDFKPGILISRTTLMYGKVGAVWADVKIKNSISADTNSQISANRAVVSSNGHFGGQSENEDTKSGLLLGIGCEQFIYKNMVTFNVEYNYEDYGHISTSTNILGGGTATISRPFTPPVTANTTLISPVVLQSTAHVKVSALLAGFNFYFGSHLI